MTNQTGVIRALRSRTALTAAAVLLSSAGLVAATAQPAADAPGAVPVFYGHRAGLVVRATGTARDDQYLSQNTTGVPGGREPFDYFGEQTAFGDLNHDGCADLAITAPGENTTKVR